VLTFNVWGLPNWITGASSVRYARIAEELAQLDCDVVFLQEVWTRRCHGVLSQEGESVARTWWTAAARRKGAFLGQNGLLTLSRHPIVSSEFRPFTSARFPDSLMRKGALRTTLALSPGRFVNVWNTHLQHGSPRVRARQLQELLRWVEAGDQGQVADVVGGDFNLVPNTEEFARLLAGVGPSVFALAGMAPFPTWDGRRGAPGGGKAIDHIFVRLRQPQGEVMAEAEPRFGAAVPEDRLSDHLGLEALLTFHGLGSSPPPAPVSPQSSRLASATAGVVR